MSQAQNIRVTVYGKELNRSMKKILSIASSVREKCEKFAMSKAACGKDYYGSQNLGCMCAVASFALAKALKKSGIKCKVMKGNFHLLGYTYGDNHCWVQVGKKIVDITATQFDTFPEVHITDVNDEQYKKDQTIRHYSDLKDWDNQSPSPVITKKILTLKKK